MRPKALLHSFKIDVILIDWAVRYEWICKSLVDKGYDIYKLDSLSIDCNKFENIIFRNVQSISLEEAEKLQFDICIYNHSTVDEIFDFKINSNLNLFLKPTVPDLKQATLDELGFGSYSSITYERPDFEDVSHENVYKFFQQDVQNWVDKNYSKFCRDVLEKEGTIQDTDYFLIVGQCFGDAVLTDQDFEFTYYYKLQSICRRLSEISNDKIIVKLHPYMNGKEKGEAGDDDYLLEDKVKYELEKISPNIEVHTGFRSIHDFLPNCKCVIVGNSGAGFEAMMYSKPIISFCQPEYHWVTYDLRKTCDLRKAIDTDSWFDKELSDKFLYWYMREYCFFSHSSARKRLDELLDYEDVYVRIK